MSARRRNADQPRLKRVGITSLDSVHTVTSAARREMEERPGMFSQTKARWPA